MDNIKKIRVSGVEYLVYDEQANKKIEDIAGAIPVDLIENGEEKKIYLVNNKGEILGNGISALVGADGKSAYQFALEGGYTGTETEFAEMIAELASIVVYNGATQSIEESLVGTWQLHTNISLSGESFEFPVTGSYNQISESGDIVTTDLKYITFNPEASTISFASDNTSGYGNLYYNETGYILCKREDGETTVGSTSLKGVSMREFTITSISDGETSIPAYSLLEAIQANATKKE